jgi:hypothetical protein
MMWTQVGIEDSPDNDTFRKPDQLISSQEEGHRLDEKYMLGVIRIVSVA